MNNVICRVNLAYDVNLYNVMTRKTYTVCWWGNYQEYKHFVVFHQALHNIEFTISLQNVMIKKSIFSSIKVYINQISATTHNVVEVINCNLLVQLWSSYAVVISLDKAKKRSAI